MRSETFRVGGPSRLDVDNPSGSVDVHVGAVDSVTVTIDGDSPEDWRVVQVGDSVSVRRSRTRGWRSQRTRIHVEAPAQSDLEISTASADVVLAGEFRVAVVRTASGGVRAIALERLDANTASGDVRVERVDAQATCNTMSGNIALGRVGGRLTASTASGDVRAKRVDGELEVGTASGDVSVEQCVGSDVSVKCMSGDVAIGLPSGIRVEPDISTLSGRVSMPAPAPFPADHEPRRTVRLRLRTVSGDIAIERVLDEAG